MITINKHKFTIQKINSDIYGVYILEFDYSPDYLIFLFINFISISKPITQQYFKTSFERGPYFQN